MKAVIVYSGKGGVGKTTTTANIARLLAQDGHKVFIIDADINTPSMNTEFEENIRRKIFGFTLPAICLTSSFTWKNQWLGNTLN